MTQQNTIRIFEERRVRTLWDDVEEKWYFSVVDVVSVLTDSIDGRKYWNKLKQRLKEEGNETVTNCHQLKMPAADGKMRLTDVADTEQLFRLIQSIPSPKAEPFKLWMAQVARERLDRMQDPELGIEQALTDYKRLGYSENWINQRLKSIEIRKELTDEWRKAIDYIAPWKLASDTRADSEQKYTDKKYQSGKYKVFARTNVLRHVVAHNQNGQTIYTSEFAVQVHVSGQKKKGADRLEYV
ncbi:MAG: Bro-N domain-containing protein [Alistipes sp.]|nr:Bro-N domain-containing protein [Alistipes sp.]